MSAVDMVNSSCREEAVDAYSDWLSVNNLAENEHLDTVKAAAADTVYGPVVASNLEHLTTHEVAESKLVKNAVGALCVATMASAKDYARDNEGTRSHKAGQGWYYSIHFGEALEQMQVNMAAGMVDLLPAGYAMTPSEAKNQVMTATVQFGNGDPRIGRLLTDANYSLYPDKRAAANHNRLLLDSLDNNVEIDWPEYLPQRLRTNLAIGLIVRDIAMRCTGKLTFIDTGAGSGDTTAVITAALAEAAAGGFLEDDSISITAIESNPNTFILLDKLAHSALNRLAKDGLDFTLVTDSNPALHAGTLSLVNQDAVDAILDIKELPHKRTDVTVVTANYSWHHLSAVQKQAIIDKIDELSSNSIFAVADSAVDAQEDQLRFYNFLSGPITQGNMGIRGLFGNRGYKFIDAGQDNLPKSISRNYPALSRQLGLDSKHDGRFWIAFKGDYAEKLVATK